LLCTATRDTILAQEIAGVVRGAVLERLAEVDIDEFGLSEGDEEEEDKSEGCTGDFGLAEDTVERVGFG
jgi:hypothetical protein